MSPLRFDRRAVLVALWEVLAAFGVFVTVYGVVWSVVMLAVGGPTVLDPRSILLFVREWANNAIPPNVQTALAALFILFLFGPAIALFRRGWLLPKGFRMSDREKVAIFRSLPTETRRRIAMKEVGNPLDHMTPEERIMLAAKLEPELKRRRAGEERLMGGVARRIRLGTERVERRAEEHERRISMDGGGKGRTLGGAVLNLQEANLLDEIRSMIRDGLAFSDRVPDMSERLRRAVLTEGNAGDEPLIEILERLAESRRAAHEAAGVPQGAPQGTLPPAVGPAVAPARSDAAVSSSGPSAEPPAGPVFPAGGSGVSFAERPSPVKAEGPEAAVDAFEEAPGPDETPFDESSGAAEDAFIVKQAVPEPMLPATMFSAKEPEVPAPAASAETPLEMHCRDIPELGAFLDAWADFTRLRAAGGLEQDGLGEVYRGLVAARRKIGEQAMSRAQAAKDWRGFDIKLVAADEVMETVKSLFDVLSSSSPDSESAWHAIFAYGSWWRIDLAAWGASEGRRSEVLSRIAAVDKAMEAAA